MKYELGMTYQDFKGLEEIVLDGKTYVNKHELIHMLGTEQKRYREGKQGGYMNLSKKQRLAVDFALNHLKVLLNKKYYDELREDMFKYLIAGASEDCFVYLRGYCEHVPEKEGEQTPIFSEYPSDAIRFESREKAVECAKKLMQDYPNLDLIPVQSGWTRTKNGLRMMHAMLGWPEDREAEDVLEEELFRAKELG